MNSGEQSLDDPYPICGVRPSPFCRVGLFSTTSGDHHNLIPTSDVDSSRENKAHKSALASMAKRHAGTGASMLQE
jgi:hypothetical protein